MTRINRRTFLASATAAGALAATHPWNAAGLLAQTATKTFSGTVNLSEGFTVPQGEVWEFDPDVSTTVVVGENVVVRGTLRMRPAAPSVRHVLRFEGVDEGAFKGGGMDVVASDVGLWVMGSGKLDLAGSSKMPWNRTGWDSSWLASDDVRVTPFNAGDYGSGGFAPFGQSDSLPSITIPGRIVPLKPSFLDSGASPFMLDIEAIAQAGITTGYGDGRFGPNDGVTRAQMAAFLVRALGLGSGGSAGFSDTSGHWAEDAIDRLAAAGITTGYGDGRFGPNDGVTRAQMAAFLVRALGLGSGGSAGFSDTSGHWAEDAIDRLAAAGITNGYGDGRFGPGDGVTRGQMAAFLRRGLQLPVPEPSEEGASSLAPEVLNLTRNVVIEGTESGRTHVIIHSAVPQSISYVEIRHVGPRKGEDAVLGRYGLHFHHCGDGSRGSLVEGVVVKHAGNHSFVPHMSHGVTLRNCIAYDVLEDAFWWDVKDRTDDVLWEGCVAALVKADPDFRGFRLAGFVLGHGDRLTVRDCVAAGVHGNVNSAGFNWPEFTEGAKIEGVWDFQDCVAHNNVFDGLFVWQNTGAFHVIESFTAYRNGQAGIDHGAYANSYTYRNSAVVESEHGLLVHANSNASPQLVFSGIGIAGCESAVTLIGSNGDPAGETLFENLSMTDNDVKVTVKGDPSLLKPRNDLFVGTDITPGDVDFVSAKSGSKFTFRLPSGETWTMDSSGNVSS